MTTCRALLVAALAGVIAAPAFAQMELKLGHVGGPGSLLELSANQVGLLGVHERLDRVQFPAKWVAGDRRHAVSRIAFAGYA